jgi:transcriptional regulator with XRE-family HTH domain
LRPTAEWLTQPGGLSERLHGLRLAARLTGDELAERAGWGSRSKVPKIENGHTAPSPEDITTWTRVTGHPEAAAELIEMLAQGTSEHRQYRHQRRHGQAALQREYDKAVRQGKRIRNFEVSFIPGLLQTPEYARYRCLEAVRVYGYPEDGVEASVAARIRRQEVLYESGRQFDFILTEAAMRFLVCPPGAMLGQVDRLASLSGLPGIALGIIPLDTELAVAPVNGFLVVDDVTYLETHTGLDSIHGQESADFDRIADLLMAEALTGDAMQALLQSIADRLRSRLS